MKGLAAVAAVAAVAAAVASAAAAVAAVVAGEDAAHGLAARQFFSAASPLASSPFPHCQVAFFSSSESP